ncbi:MAG: HlyC/CorC family transporter [Lachnospiraceae bacterium]|jgi:CBS domain containing-hemolysin-like protein|nr:HlyC/CorC family transporter [Lachnospiraceae bacterium]MCI9283619.1 HlyC/CorC family transporter [Lachnospiraceae bacterium]
MLDSGDSTGIQICTVVVLLCLSAFFSSAETALTTVNRMRVRTLAEAGDKRALTLTKVIEEPGKMLSTILVGNNIVNLSASSLMTTLTMQIFGSKAVGVATGILTLLILVFGEISPKTLATIHSERLALRYAGLIYLLMTLLTPVIFCINQLSLGFLLLLRVDPNKKQEAITEDELRTIVEVSHEEGVIESEEKKMINNVFDFGDSVAKDVMVPRIDMVMVDVDTTFEELMEIFRREKFTRFPVYEGTTDNVIGIINVKDFLLAERKAFTIRDFLRQPLYTYEYKKTAELMVEMRKTFNNFIIVLDEYGATAGMVTLEDMLEEIVGEIRDEYDEDEEDAVKMIAADEYLVSGSTKLDDLNSWLNLKLESEDYDSIGGLVIGLLEHLPEMGEEVSHEGLRLVVERVEKNRIEKIHLYILSDEEKEAKETDDTNRKEHLGKEEPVETESQAS